MAAMENPGQGGVARAARPRLARFRGILFVVALSVGAYVVAHVPGYLGFPNPAQVVLQRLEGTGFLAAGIALIVGFLVLAIRRGTRLRSGFDARVKAEAATAERRAAEAERTRIFSALAHELGNLITPMRLQVQILQLSPDMAANDTRSVAIFDRSVGRLTAFLQDVLDLARLQNQRLRLNLTPTGLADVARVAVDAHQATAASRGIHLTFTSPSSDTIVAADPRRLDQVLSNLLNNAIKFTPSGGRIDVTVEARATEVVVRVRDTGPGMSKDEATQLFQPFTTLGGAQQGALTGTGLGLFISKSLVEAHGGRIGAHSPGPGQGSTFHFTIPREPQNTASAVAPQPAAASPPTEASMTHGFGGETLRRQDPA